MGSRCPSWNDGTDAQLDSPFTLRPRVTGQAARGLCAGAPSARESASCAPPYRLRPVLQLSCLRDFEVVCRSHAAKLGLPVKAISARRYEVTIRFRDGSRQIFNEATPRTWRSGTAVKIID
jgi:hypothetical protein